MAHASTARRPAQWPTAVQLLLAAVAVEAILLFGYFLATPGDVRTLRYVLYPFVWINAVILAVAAVDVPRAPRVHHVVAGVVAAAYFLLLANWAGLFGLTVTGHHPVPEGVLGLHVSAGSPGIQRVRLVTGVFYVSFVPYRVIGYLGLAYLVYAAALDLAGAVLSGAVGLLSCLSCSFPIVASLATGVWGGSVTLMSTVYAYSMDLSTVAFLVSVALLYWRPGFPRALLGRRSPDGDESASGRSDPSTDDGSRSED